MRTPFRRRKLERGIAAVEFALCAVAFFAFMGALVETARVVYLVNTMGEVARRGARMAAVTNFCDKNALAALRLEAVFGGSLPAADNITDKSVAISYLQADASTPVAALPASPEQNLSNCTVNATAPNCIRFVRVRVCRPGTDCARIGYLPWLPVTDLMPAGGIPLSDFTTVTPAENFGYRPDAASACSG
ncbi:TadE/TadG family type IV pilus assembly protein [Massilia glaciei]|nr:TadE family protein [Massilia glaciei]